MTSRIMTILSLVAVALLALVLLIWLGLQIYDRYELSGEIAELQANSQELHSQLDEIEEQIKNCTPTDFVHAR